MRRYLTSNKFLCLIFCSAVVVLAANCIAIEKAHQLLRESESLLEGHRSLIVSEPLLSARHPMSTKTNEINRTDTATDSDSGLDKTKYHDWTVDDMDKYFKCEDDMPLIPQSAWINARKTYASLHSSQLHIPLPDHRFNGFSFPVEGRKADGKGRGLFALRDIRKGELVWKPKQTAKFANGEEYRDFIFSLDENFVCNALNFSYIQAVHVDNSHGGGEKDKSQIMILVDLDEGGLCNDAYYYDEMNIGCDERLGDIYEGGCQENYFALQDIKAGDELICDYYSFTADEGWEHFGL